MKPEFAKAAEELKVEGLKCKMAMLDCTTNPNVAEEYAISGFPTIKLFVNGQPITDYQGSRTLDDLKKFMKSHVNKGNKDEL